MCQENKQKEYTARISYTYSFFIENNITIKNYCTKNIKNIRSIELFHYSYCKNPISVYRFEKIYKNTTISSSDETKNHSQKSNSSFMDYLKCCVFSETDNHSEQSNALITTDVSVIYSYFKELNVLLISFCFELKDESLGNIIKLRQIFDNMEFKNINQFFPKINISGKTTMTQYNCDKEFTPYIDIDTLNNSYIDKQFIIEIIEFPYFSDEGDAKKVEENCPEILYGIITGDEGYSGVEMNDERIKYAFKNCWSTRKYVRFYTVGNAALLLNFRNSKLAKCIARESLCITNESIASGPNDDNIKQYLGTDCPIAGFNHGITLCIENKMVLNAVIHHFSVLRSRNILLKPFSCWRYHHKLKSSFNRKDFHINKFSEYLKERLKIPEIGRLQQIIFDDSNIKEDLEEIVHDISRMESVGGIIFTILIGDLVFGFISELLAEHLK